MSKIHSVHRSEQLGRRLILVASGGKVSKIKYLMDAGADIHMDSDQALRNVERSNNVDMVYILLHA